MRDFKPGLWYLRDMTKMHAYYFLLIVGSVFFGSGIGLITSSTRSGSESVGSAFLAFGIIAIVLLSIFQDRLLIQEQRFVNIKFRAKSISLKRTFVDALLFQYYLFTYSAVYVEYVFWFYIKNGNVFDIKQLAGFLLITPIFLVIAHNNVGRFIRRVFALLPLICTIIFLCLTFFR
jgi:hypothetical protein